MAQGWKRRAWLYLEPMSSGLLLICNESRTLAASESVWPVSLFLICHISHAASDDARQRIDERVAASFSSVLPLKGAWIIESEDTADAIRDQISACVPDTDGVIVTSIGNQAAWTGLTDSHTEWLIEHL
jgi:hypothetical protein